MANTYRDQLTGRQRNLYDDLQAVLRANGYDDAKAEPMIELLNGDDDA